jgi:hypothetical protein
MCAGWARSCRGVEVERASLCSVQLEAGWWSRWAVPALPHWPRVTLAPSISTSELETLLIPRRFCLLGLRLQSLASSFCPSLGDAKSRSRSGYSPVPWLISNTSTRSRIQVRNTTSIQFCTHQNRLSQFAFPQHLVSSACQFPEYCQFILSRHTSRPALASNRSTSNRSL